MIPLARVQEILAPQNWSVQNLSNDVYSTLVDDLDEGDIYELGRGPQKDWRTALRSTLEAPGASFYGTSKDHDGSVVFGITPYPGNAGRIWMLQSKTFAVEARRFHGNRLAYKMGRSARSITKLFLEYHCPLFNFIPSSQTRNIRWLKQAGFEFFHRTDVKTDMLFFAQGPHTVELANFRPIWDACLGASLDLSDTDDTKQNLAV